MWVCVLAVPVTCALLCTNTSRGAAVQPARPAPDNQTGRQTGAWASLAARGGGPRAHVTGPPAEGVASLQE